MDKQSGGRKGGRAGRAGRAEGQKLARKEQLGREIPGRLLLVMTAPRLGSENKPRERLNAAVASGTEPRL
jgi:hypothetical protein